MRRHEDHLEAGSVRDLVLIGGIASVVGAACLVVAIGVSFNEPDGRAVAGALLAAAFGSLALVLSIRMLCLARGRAGAAAVAKDRLCTTGVGLDRRNRALGRPVLLAAGKRGLYYLRCHLHRRPTLIEFIPERSSIELETGTDWLEAQSGAVRIVLAWTPPRTIADLERLIRERFEL